MSKIYKILYLISIIIGLPAIVLYFYDSIWLTLLFVMLYVLLNVLIIYQFYNKRLIVHKMDIALISIYYVIILSLICYYFLVNNDAIIPGVSFEYVVKLLVIPDLLLRLYSIALGKKEKVK